MSAKESCLVPIILLTTLTMLDSLFLLWTVRFPYQAMQQKVKIDSINDL